MRRMVRCFVFCSDFAVPHHAWFDGFADNCLCEANDEVGEKELQLLTEVSSLMLGAICCSVVEG